MNKKPMIQLTDRTIPCQKAIEWVQDVSCGAVASFQGNIRCNNDNKRVLGLEYEVFEKMFYVQVEKIFSEIKSKWKIGELALIQRSGKLDVGETGIFIAISSPHRREALEACAYAIEEFKRRAPVWKKEYYADGSAWIVCQH